MYLRMILISAAGALAAIALWTFLFRRHRAGRLPAGQLLTVALAVGLSCRVAYALWTPTFYAPDEQSHFQYVRWLAEHRTLPVQNRVLDLAAHDWEYHQPPLYYVGLTPVYLLADGLFHERAVTVRALRLVSILLWGLTVMFALRFLDQMGLNDDFLRTSVVAMLCLLPTYTFLSSAINNDNPIIALGSAISWRMAKPPTARNSLWLGVLVGLALLTKFTAIAFILLLFLVPSVGLIRRTKGPSMWPHAALSISLAALLWAPWALRSLRLYESITADNVTNSPPREWPSTSGAILSTLGYMQDSFWAVSGVYNNINFYYPSLGRHLAYVACLGLLIGMLFKRDRLLRALPANRELALALVLAMLMNAGLVFRFGLENGQGQGRFLFTLLAPTALLIGTGLRMFTLTEREDAPLHLTGLFLTYATSFTFHSLAVFPRGAVPWGPSG